MSPKKATELPRIMDLGTAAPKRRKDEIPHWKVWAWAKCHPGQAWKR